MLITFIKGKKNYRDFFQLLKKKKVSFYYLNQVPCAFILTPILLFFLIAAKVSSHLQAE